MSDLVSIIVPVYRVEKYINKCVDSVLRQSYKNFELILVDDGSPDNCGNICDDYANSDNRIKVIHKQNGGLSSARNAGIDVAKGDYVTFLDSDDVIENHYFEKLLSLCKQNQAQIAIMKMMRVPADFNEKEYVPQSKNAGIEILSPEKAIEYSLLQKEYTCCAPGKLYEKEVLKKIRFPEGRLSEDLATCHLFLDKAKKVAYSHEIGYYYRQHERSIMHIFKKERLDALEWAESIEAFCKKSYPSIVQSAKCRTFNVAFLLLLEAPDNEKECQRELWDAITRTRKSVFCGSKVRIKEKIAAIISLLGIEKTRSIGNKLIGVVR